MVTLQLPTTDTAGTALVWRMLENLSHSAESVGHEDDPDGISFVLKVLVFGLALLVLGIFSLSGILVVFARAYLKTQKEGMDALSKNKDNAKREIMGILEKQLSAADAANREAAARLRNELAQLDHAYNLISLDLVVLAQKCKVSLMSLPSHKPTNQENFPPNQE